MLKLLPSGHHMPCADSQCPKIISTNEHCLLIIKWLLQYTHCKGKLRWWPHSTQPVENQVLLVIMPCLQRPSVMTYDTLCNVMHSPRHCIVKKWHMCQTSWVNYDQLSHKSSCHRRKLFLLPGLPNCEQWHLAKGGALESAGRICHKHLEEETTLTASSSFTLFSGNNKNICSLYGDIFFLYSALVQEVQWKRSIFQLSTTQWCGRTKAICWKTRC